MEAYTRALWKIETAFPMKANSQLRMQAFFLQEANIQDSFQVCIRKGSNDVHISTVYSNTSLCLHS